MRNTTRRIGLLVSLLLAVGSPAAAAPPAAPPAAPTPAPPSPATAAGDEPGLAGCSPACRTGYTCKQSRCVSLCNPPCGAGEVCVRGDCEMRVTYNKKKRRKKRGMHRYFGVSGGYRIAVNDSAAGMGEVRAEFGSRYGSAQIGPAFGDKRVSLRTAILGQVPIQLSTLPLYIAPALSIGYTFTWIDDDRNTAEQDIFITPAIRLIYKPHPRVSLRADLIQVEINFLRIASDDIESAHRIKVVPIQWGLAFGVFFHY